MGAEVTGEWRKEIVGAMGIGGERCLLRVVSYSRQVMVQESGNEFVAHDGFNGWPSDPKLAAWVVSNPMDGVSDHLRLIDRRNRLRMMRHPGSDPRKLRGIDRRQVNGRKADTAAVVNQFGSK